jgi:hypothetical protein
MKERRIGVPFAPRLDRTHGFRPSHVHVDINTAQSERSTNLVRHNLLPYIIILSNYHFTVSSNENSQL